MKAASAVWKESETDKLKRACDLLDIIEACVKEAAEDKVDILVFPALTGCLYQYLSTSCKSLEELRAAADCNGYLSNISLLSKKYGLALCPGSYWERKGYDIFHSSCLIAEGNTVLEQRQLYLARWERQQGLNRGTAPCIYVMDGWKIGIVLSTDVFYPQVSRFLALHGADIILSPVAFTGVKNKALQLGGMWQETQQNLFFCIESGFNGNLGNRSFWGDSFIHAPLEMTEGEDGFLIKAEDSGRIITAELDNQKRKTAISKFDVLSLMNQGFCRNMQGFGRQA